MEGDHVSYRDVKFGSSQDSQAREVRAEQSEQLSPAA